MGIGMNLALWIARIRGWLAGRPFERAARDPLGAQNRLLQQILHENRHTAFGLDHGFADLSDYDAFQRQVPIQDYEGHRPYVDQIATGRLDALTQEPPFRLGSTSGTTNQPKWVPITQSWQAKMAGLLRFWIARTSWSHPRMFNHKTLTVVSPAVEEKAPSGMPVGSISGVTNRRAPWVIRRMYAVPYEVATLGSYHLRYFMLMRFSLQNSLSCIVTPNPSTLLQLAQLLEAQAKTLIAALHSGKLGIDPQDYSEEDQKILAGLVNYLRPLPKRARKLSEILKDKGCLLPRDCWPQLAFIGCWLGGSAGVHARQLRSLYGDVGLRDLGFRATEGTFTVPLEDDSAAGVLALDAHVYEFIPETEITAENPTVLRAHELEIGQQYYLLITTRAGLYRYDINDVVEVTGTYRQAPIVRFLRKGRDMVNMVGEKLHVNQLLAAAHRARQDTGLQWRQFQVLPDTEACCYHLLLESEDAQLTTADLDAFSQAFDAALMDENPEYPTKRQSQRLGAPRWIHMKAGWSDRERQRAVEAGKRDVQFKWPYILEGWRPDLDDEVLGRANHT